MKSLLFSTAALIALFGGNTLAHDIHNKVSDHPHYQPYYYTHTVSSHLNHHKAHHHYNGYYQNNHKHYTPYNYTLPKVTTNTSTYYTRSYPVKNTYTYHTTPNTTIHHPPYAYSSCANRCDQSEPRRITVSRNLGSNTITYRAPSEYSAQERYTLTPRHNHSNNYYRQHYTNNHVSPFKKHMLTTTTCHGCNY